MDDNEQKKIRNRLSQRAFRRRQAEYLRELRNRVAASEKPDSERIVALEEENSLLRAQLTKVQSQLERYQTNLQVMVGSISKTLCENAAAQSSENKECEKTQPSLQGEGGEQKIPDEGIEAPLETDSWLTLFTDDCTRSTTTENTLSSSLQNVPCSTSMPATVSNRSIVSTARVQDEPITGTGSEIGGLSLTESSIRSQQIPDIWTFSYQMGTQSYVDALAASHQAGTIYGQSWVDSNSPFSDHIQILKNLLLSTLKQSELATDNSYQAVYQPVSAVLAMFNSMTRPDVMNWYATTRFFHIVELTAWQIFPSPMTFARLHERYRPTELQMRLQTQYPCVIDWIPFSSIRNRLIRLHSANPYIDQIFCDAVSAYVVEASLSQLVAGELPVMVYVRVMDLIVSMALAQDTEETDNPTLPAPNADILFSSPKYARLVFRHLNMDRGASYYKVDPAFFEKYPELRDPSDNITASGIPLKPQTQLTLTYPAHLNTSIVGTYRSFIEFSIDATVRMAKMDYHQYNF